MSLNLIEYEISKLLMKGDIPFNALIAASIRKADSFNSAKLKIAFPEIEIGLQKRYNAPGGVLAEDSCNSIESTMDRASRIAANYINNCVVRDCE